MELSKGDDSRVEEVKEWLKGGMRIAEVREKLEEIGYSPYHISFLLEKSTGQRFLPSKPSVLIDKTNIRIAMAFAGVVVAVLLAAWLFPEAMPW